MGKRENELKIFLLEKFGGCKYSKPKKVDFNQSKFNIEIAKVYQMLGGKLEDYPTGYRGFDIQCNGFIVELDEERHFNRYRLQTLNSNLYSDFQPLFDLEQYKTFCIQKEQKCLSAASWQGNWENNSTKKQFGPSDDEGVLGQRGSSRWKQRAFYDMLRDVSSLIINIPIIRISIWEEVDGSLVINLIKTNQFDKLIQVVQPKLTLGSF